MTDRERAKRYRQRAAKYLAMADCKLDGERRALVELAATYHRLASELEGYASTLSHSRA
jgi:hypothetical protein